MVKKGLTVLGLLLTQNILLFEQFIENNFYQLRLIFCDALRDLIPFVQFKKRENTHRELLLLLMRGYIIT